MSPLVKYFQNTQFLKITKVKFTATRPPQAPGKMGESCIFTELAFCDGNCSRYSTSAASKSFYYLSLSVKLKLGSILEAYICPSIHFLEKMYRYSLRLLLHFHSLKVPFLPARSEASRIKSVQGIFTSWMAHCHDYRHENHTSEKNPPVLSYAFCSQRQMSGTDIKYFSSFTILLHKFRF